MSKTLATPVRPVGPSGRVSLAWAVAAVCGLLAVIPLDQRLRGTAAPHGILSYELAGTAERSGAILQQWAADAVTDVARLMMAIDLGYPLVYGWALVIGLRWAAGRSGRGSRPSWLAWPAVGAAAADYVENAALLWQLAAGRATVSSAAVAAGAAWVKFALILACLALIARLALRRRPGPGVPNTLRAGGGTATD